MLKMRYINTERVATSIDFCSYQDVVILKEFFHLKILTSIEDFLRQR